MKYRVNQEPKNPESGSLELIEDLIAKAEPDTAGMSEWFHRYAQNHHRRLAYDIDYVRRYVQREGRILECGAIPLLLTGALQMIGYSVHGVDIAPERFAKAIVSLNLMVSKVNIETERLPFSDGEFDAIIFNELFEHLRINPIFTMKEVYRVTKPSGTLLLSTPNLKSLDGMINFVFRDRAYSCVSDIYDEYSKLETLGHMGHTREYTTFEVCHFLRKIGFTIDEVIYRGYYQSKGKQKVIGLFPSLRPFVTIVAIKRISE
jgi:SAM-dependent methyltransferase